MNLTTMIFIFGIIIISIPRVLIPFLSNKQKPFGIAIPLEEVNNVEVVNNKFACAIASGIVTMLPTSYILRSGRIDGDAFLVNFLMLLFIDVVLFFVYNYKIKNIAIKEDWEIPVDVNTKMSKLTPFVIIFPIVVITAMYFIL